ncbi:energy-coupled thiamine transporter ThiT [Streptococcus sp. sy018]|uniref:energy-coupled thiamine transporter ThiT n=1 Tax=Streptococcus sp. sy018 TaxID=2600147 RepID=UPI0011B3D1E2|nr:energy-coupled thiamine transporter ThiT [Streptococcus sp. sy018]TWS94198.1 energy-coupled thiamine transporter ThiT [Streptococcus sp. sy018]
MSSLASTKVTERALLLALALILDKLILFQLPQGGNISLGMLPLIIFALRHGLAAGLFLGGLAGGLQLFLGGYFLSPLQFLLDYPIAYAMIGLAGIVNLKHTGKLSTGRLLLGVSLASLARLFAHTLAGIVFYSAYAPKGTPVWLYSLSYNASYMLPSAILVSVVLLLLSKKNPKLFSV